MNHMGYVTRSLHYRHFFVHNLRPRELRYRVKFLGNYFKVTEEDLSTPNFLESRKYLFFKQFFFAISSNN